MEQDHQKLNREIMELEQRQLQLNAQLLDINSAYTKMRLESINTRNQVQKELAEITRKLAQLRRNFKLEGYTTRKMRSLTTLEKELIIQRANNQCYECKNNKDLTVHHVKPLSHGGTHELINLQVLCLNCHAKHHRIA